MIASVIFDLDMCIFDTTSIGPRFVDPVLNPLRESSMPRAKKEEIERAFWTMPLEDVFKRFRIPSVVEQSMRAVQRGLTAPEWVRTYGDEQCLLALPVYRALVTSGYRSWQESKIERLGVANLFHEIIIDAIDDPELRVGKKAIFEGLVARHEWQPNEVLVVGDSPSSELGAGKELGMVTVQTLRPRIKRAEGFDYYITSLTELTQLIQR